MNSPLSNNPTEPTEWYPAKFFDYAQKPETPYDLLLLNQPLNVRAYKQVFRDASRIVCADGGANKLYDVFQETKELPIKRFPDAIVGDLDSLREDVRDFFEDTGKTEIIRIPEQDSTDFTKALSWLRTQNRKRLGNCVDVVALGGLGGRVDQAFSVIHHLIKAVSDTDLLDGDIYLLSEQSLSFVLKKGRNIIHGGAPGQATTLRENAGIIPILGPATISTKGLEWNVKDWKTEFGGQISTSNHVKASAVEIDASSPVLFTVELVENLCTQ